MRRPTPLRATYDPGADAAYIYLTGEELGAGRLTIPTPTDGHADLPQDILDFKDGRLVGVEVLGAKEGLHADCMRFAKRLQEYSGHVLRGSHEMGATFTVIAARGTQEPGEIAQLDRIDDGDAWSVFRPVDRYVYPSTIRDLTIEAATSVSGVALAGFVEDSDFAFLLAATYEGALVWLFIDPENAEDYAEGAEALQLASPRTGDEAERFATWSQRTPQPVDSDSLRQLLGQDSVFSEEPMMAVFESLGIQVPWNAV